MTEQSVFNIENTALEGLLLLLSQDFDILEEIEEFEQMESVFPLVTEMIEDYRESEEYEPNKAYLIGKHLEEFGKAIQDESKDDALVVHRLSDEKTQYFYGNKMTLSNRPKYKYPTDDPKYNRLEKDFKAISKTRTAYKKKLRDSGKVDANDSFSISVSKS